MKLYQNFFLLFLPGLLFFNQAIPAQEITQIKEEAFSLELFDDNWLFFRGGAMGANQPGFDDSQWRKVDLPHDWSIEDLPGTSSPFDPDAVGQVSSGFTVGGTGWYRKQFIIPEGLKGKQVMILFEGIYMNADVWLNGESVGNHPYGYTSFWLDLSDNVKFGGVNTLAIQVKNEGQTSRWYSGSGIYRHVWLRFTDQVHIEEWGTSVITSEITSSFAKIKVNTRLVNKYAIPSAISLVTRILDKSGNEKLKTETPVSIPANEKQECLTEIRIEKPDLWSLENPDLYTLISEVYSNGKIIDNQETKFGIRSISFDTENGFMLNGVPVELKGGCVHHDNGPLGSRTYDRAEERRVEILKANGFNAIRCAHNPPSPGFLNACDRLGMLVIDEAFDMWIYANNPSDYHLYFRDWWKRDIESMVRRDINHPSVILWSIGNEIAGMDSPEVVEVANELAAYVHKLDNTRPVTAAVNSINEKKDPFFAALDICGYNYGRKSYVSDHQRMPGRIMFCSESYPLETFEYWTDAKKYSWVVGDFVWTAFDHIGEASIGWRGYWQEKNFYPWNIAYCGDIDICGWKRPQSYYRDVLWSSTPSLSVFVKPPQPSFPLNPNREDWSIWHWEDVVDKWTWPDFDGVPLEVKVYSSCEKVELFLNNKSLGLKETSFETKYTASWMVPYSEGELRAAGYNGSKKIVESKLSTSGTPVKISLSADKTNIIANNQDLSYITVEILDEKGIRNPNSEDLVTFELSGPGSIVAVGNGNPVSLESFQQNTRKAWRGRCLIIVKSGKTAGEIRLKASVKGLPSSEIVINVRNK